MSIEAMKHYEAALLEAFPRGATGDVFEHWNKARQAIEQAEKQEQTRSQKLRDAGFTRRPKGWERDAEQAEKQKPVAWGVFEGNLHDMFFTQKDAKDMARLKGDHAEVKPLYTTPQPQRERVIFPTMLRKMWSGGEVQAWLDENVNKEKNHG